MQTVAELSADPVEGKNRNALRYLQAVYDSIKSDFYLHKQENSQDFLPCSRLLLTHTFPEVSESAGLQYFLDAQYSEYTDPSGLSATNF